MNKLLSLCLTVLVFTSSFFASAKDVKIKLTGTIYEPVEIIFGSTGRKATVDDLPYVFVVDKKELPMKLKFNSASYLYYDISIPAKPFDSTGHVYLVKVNENAMALRGSSAPQPMASAPANIPTVEEQKSTAKSTFNPNEGINAAPKTNIKNDNTFALIISNEEYDLAANVDNAMNDGLAFKEYCIKTLGVPSDNVRYFSNLSFGRMRKAFTDMLELAELLHGQANVLIYYAGHGIPDNKTKDAFLMPVDADGTDTGVCLSLASLYDNINSKDLNKCVVFIDACFSGAQRGGDMIVAARGVKLKPTETIPSGKTIVFSATSDDEAAYSHKAESHGLFTYFLLSKLKETKGNVTLGDLATYISDKVSFESRRINNKAQTPRVSVAPGMADSWKSLKLTK